MSRRLLVATTNAGKLREIRDLLQDVDIDVLTLDAIPGVAAPDETGSSFEDNARLKATYYGQHAAYVTVAEDSGLVIDALDGAPGIHSARYLGESATYQERFDRIFTELGRHADRPRTARFVCALAVADGGRVVYETTQTIEGEIARDVRGAEGFGYDPIFIYPPYGRTLAQVTREEKLKVAHRGKAFRALAEWLRAHPAVGSIER